MIALVSTSKTVAAVVAGCTLLVLSLAGIAGLTAGQPQEAGSAQRIQIGAEPAGAPADARLQAVAQAASSNGSDPAGGIGAPGSGEIGAPGGRGIVGIGAVPAEMQKYAVLDYKSRSPGEEKIVAALEEHTTIEFIETPLIDAVEFLKDLHGVPILFDVAALDGVGVGTDTPVTITVSGVSFRSALALLLRPLGLDYVIRDEVLQITTIAVAERVMETHVYELRHIPKLPAEKVAEVIRAVIRPTTWDEHLSPEATFGGTDSAAVESPSRATVVALEGALVVTQSQRAHAEIVELIRQLDNFSTNPLYK
jgi:hypothetical protein